MEQYIKGTLYNEIVSMYENEEFNCDGLERLIDFSFKLYFLYVHDFLYDKIKENLEKEIKKDEISNV